MLRNRRLLSEPVTGSLAGRSLLLALAALADSVLIGACALAPVDTTAPAPAGTVQPVGVTPAAITTQADWRQRPAPPDPRWDPALYWVYLASQQGEFERASSQLAVKRDGQRLFVSLTAATRPQTAIGVVTAAGGQVTTHFRDHINAYVPVAALPQLVGHREVRRLWVPHHRTPGEQPDQRYLDLLATREALPPDKVQPEMRILEAKATQCRGLDSQLSQYFMEPDQNKVTYQLGRDYRDGLVEVAFQVQGEEGDLAQRYGLRDVRGFRQYREGRIPLALLCEFAKDARVAGVGRVSRPMPGG